MPHDQSNADTAASSPEGKDVKQVAPLMGNRFLVSVGKEPIACESISGTAFDHPLDSIDCISEWNLSIPEMEDMRAWKLVRYIRAGALIRLTVNRADGGVAFHTIG